MKLVGDVGNWKIVAHIAFKFYSVASGTFSTGSTFTVSGARRFCARPSQPWVRTLSINDTSEVPFHVQR